MQIILANRSITTISVNNKKLCVTVLKTQPYTGIAKARFRCGPNGTASTLSMYLVPTTIINYRVSAQLSKKPQNEIIGSSCRTPRLLEFHRGPNLTDGAQALTTTKWRLALKFSVAPFLESATGREIFQQSRTNVGFVFMAMSSSNLNSQYCRFVSCC